MSGDYYNLRPNIVPYSWMAAEERHSKFTTYEPAQWVQDPARVKDWEIVSGSRFPRVYKTGHMGTGYYVETALFSTGFTVGKFTSD